MLGERISGKLRGDNFAAVCADTAEVAMAEAYKGGFEELVKKGVVSLCFGDARAAAPR